MLLQSLTNPPKIFERSVSVVYRTGILSNRKYCELRSSEMFDLNGNKRKRRRTEFKEGCKVPSLVPFQDLMKFISEQNIGTLHNIPQARADSKSRKRVKKFFRICYHPYLVIILTCKKVCCKWLIYHIRK